MRRRTPFHLLWLPLLALHLALVARSAEAQGPPPVPDADADADAGLEEVAAEEHAEAHAAEGEILSFQPELGVFTVIVFVLLLLVLWRFAWGPLSRALHDREHHLEQAFEEAEKARSEAAALLDQHRKQMEEASAQVRSILEQARADAQKTADGIVKQAQSEAEASRARAERDIHQARDEALMDIWSKSADLAAAVARRVLAREMSDEDHRRLVQVAVEELPARPEGNGQGGQVA